MTAILIILSMFAYAGVGAWIFGFVRAAVNDKENGWETPLPLFSSIFWPISLTIITLRSIMVPAEKMGYAFQRNQLEKKKKRIAQQEKIRIQLQEAEKEIEKICKEMDQEELDDVQLDAPLKKRAARK